MSDPVVSYLVIAVGPLVLKTAMFVVVFRRRRHRVSLPTCMILAGAPMLVALIPLPLPAALMVFVGIGIALYVLAQYTQVPPFPEGVAIVAGVEIVSRLVVEYVVALALQ